MEHLEKSSLLTEDSIHHEDFIDSVADELKKRIHTIQVSRSMNLAYQEEYEKLKTAFQVVQADKKKAREEVLFLNEKYNQTNVELARLTKLLEQANNHNVVAESYSTANENRISELQQDIVVAQNEAAHLRGKLSSLRNSSDQDIENWKAKSVELSHKIYEFKKVSSYDLQVRDQKICDLTEALQELRQNAQVLQNEKDAHHSKLDQLQFTCERVTREKKSLENYLSEKQAELRATSWKLVTSLAVRKRIRTFYKKVIQALRRENANFQAELAAAKMLARENHALIETLTLQTGFMAQKQSKLKKAHAAEKAIFEDNFIQKFNALKAEFEMKARAINEDTRAKLAQYQEQLERSKRSNEALRADADSRTHALNTRLSAETQKRLKLHQQYDDYSRSQNQARTTNFEHNEELRMLKEQLQMKSKRIIELELALLGQ